MATRAWAARLAAILTGLGAAGPAAAQGFSGAELSAEVLGFTDDLDLGQTTYRGSLEFNVAGNFGVAADLSYYGFRSLDAENRNLTLHAIYDAGPTTSAGLFYAADDLEEGSADLLGIEGGATFMGVGAEGFLARVDGEGDDGVTFGVDAAYDLGSFALTGAASVLSFEDAGDASRITAGAEFQLGQGPTLFGEVGHLSVDDEGGTFVSLGARIAIGPNAGTTFNSRSVFETLTAF